MPHGGVQLVLLARDERDARTELAERLRDLQAEPARPAGDERRAAAQIEQLPHSHDLLPPRRSRGSRRWTIMYPHCTPASSVDLPRESRLLRRRARLSRRGPRLAPRKPAAALRDKVARYAHLTRDDLIGWHRILADKGWIAPAWPAEWGGTGWNVVQRYIFEEECGYAGAPPLMPFGLAMCAPVLLKFGTDGAEAAFPAAHLSRRRLLVPGLLRAELRLRSCLAADVRGAARRPLRRQRPEDLDDARAHGRLDLLPRAHRRRRSSASRTGYRSC